MIFAMTKEQYIKITEPLRSNPERANRVTSLNHVLTALVFCVYPLYLFMLFADRSMALARNTCSGSVLCGTFHCQENHQCAQAV